MKIRTGVLAVVLMSGLALPRQATAQVTVDVQVAADIVDRMPSNPANTFPVDVGEVVCWTLVEGGADMTIQHIWIHDEMEFPVALQVGGSPWRTWSRKTIPEAWAGDWRIEIRDEQGNLLDTVSFTVGG